jgi:multidrug resistance efflux pump
VQPGGLSTALAAHIRAASVRRIVLDVPVRVISAAGQTGRTVRAGETLAELDSPEARAALERAQLRYRSAEARVAALEGRGGTTPLFDLDVRSADSRRELARQRLAGFRLDEQETALARAQSDLRRVENLASQALANAQEVESARRRVEAHERALENARATRRDLEGVERHAASDADAARVRASAARSTDLPAALAELDAARREVEYARQRVQDLQVRAPVQGTIVQWNGAPGETLPAGTALAEIADLSVLHFDAPVGPAVARALRTGDMVRVRIPGDPPLMIQAPIARIMLSAESGERSYILRVTAPNPAPADLLAGQEGLLEILHGAPGRADARSAHH